MNFGRCGFSGFKVCGSPTSAKWWHIPVCDLAPEPEWIVTCSEGGDQFKHVCILMVGRRHLPMAAMWIVVWDTRTCHVSRILVDVGHGLTFLLLSWMRAQNPTRRLVGNGRQPSRRSTSSFVSRSCQGWTTPTAPCAGPSTDLWRQCSSPLCPRLQRREWMLSPSVFWCAERCICPFHSLCVPADVAVNLTCLATIVQRARRQRCSRTLEVTLGGGRCACLQMLEVVCPRTFT